MHLLHCLQLNEFLKYQTGCAGRTDMFWDQGAYNNTALDMQCLARFNATARPDWAVREYGGFRGADAASNIIFSNGELDPWITGARMSTMSLRVCKPS